MYHKQMRDAIRKALCFSDLTRVIQTGSLEAYNQWLESWTVEERHQAQTDLQALLKLERITRKELIDHD